MRYLPKVIPAVTILGTVITKIPGTVVSTSHILTHVILWDRYSYYSHFTKRKIQSLHNLREVTQLNKTE